MKRPKEIDVPSWAGSMVGNYRRSQSLPAHITDGMIFAVCEDYKACDPDDIEEAMGHLRSHTGDTMDSLTVTDEQSTAVAVAPRVTKAYIESSIAEVIFTIGGNVAAEGVNGPKGPEPWRNAREFCDTDQCLKYDHHTLCMITTKAGFTVIGHSAPASPENFNAELGRQFAYENAFRQLWPLFAFAALEMTDAGVTFGAFGQEL